MRALWRFAMAGILLMPVPLVFADPLGGLKDFFSTLPKSDLTDEDEDEESTAAEQYDLKIDLRAWRRGGQTFARLPALERHLNRVAKRVLGSKADARRPVQVIIAPSAAFGAYTLPNGGIFVNLGTILALRSEDEVAALLGHEIAHLLLRHHDSDEYRNLLDKSFRVAELYMASRGQQFGKRDFLKLQAASWVSQKALFPAWSRKQEDATPTVHDPPSCANPGRRSCGIRKPRAPLPAIVGAIGSNGYSSPVATRPRRATCEPC